MQIIKCKNCGGQLDITRAVGGVIECEYCHSKHTLAKSADVNAVNFIAMGEHALDVGKFDDAYAAYGKAVECDNAEPEAYFGKALAANKIRFIKDVKNNRLQPICYDATDKSFASDGDYVKALSLATVEQRNEYMRRAQEIDHIRGEFYKLKRMGREYDCFICVKVTDDQTRRKTIDSDRANDIYYHLKDKGYKPFYSEREIQNETGTDYEARILYALFSSPCMLVVCSDESYLQTPWVKNEYSRFISLINDEQKEADSIAIGFFDKPIERLPGRNGRLQGVCLKNPDAYSKIVDFVDNCSPAAMARNAYAEEMHKAQEAELTRKIEEQEKAQRELSERISALQQSGVGPSQSMAVGGNTEISSLIVRANQFFENGDFNSAVSYCNRVLDIDPTNGAAWLGLLMAKLKASSPSVLIQRAHEYKFANSNEVLKLLNCTEYKNSQKYATEHKETLAELENYLNSVYANMKQREDKLEEQKKKLAEEREAEEMRRKELERFIECCCISGTYLIGIKGYCRDAIKEIVIPDSVTKIGDSAFIHCYSLRSITIPDSVTEIGDSAFSFCHSLRSITIPDSVTKIGDSAFYSCSGLTSIKVSAGNKNYHSAGNCLIETESKTLIRGCENSIIPTDGSVTNIGNRAFDGCSGLTNVKIPNGVTSIGDETFGRCFGLKSIEIPNSVICIGRCVFDGIYRDFTITFMGIKNQWKKVKKKKWNKHMKCRCKVVCTDTKN